MDQDPFLQRLTQAIAVAVTLSVLLCAAEVHAQIALPNVQLPPLGQGPLDVTQTVAAVNGAADLERLRALRQLRIRDLLRTYPAALERGPRGVPIVRNEVVALSPSAEALEAARASGFSILRERMLDGLDARVVILQAPAGWSTQRALRRLRALDRDGVYDLNHVYFESGAAAPPATAPALTHFSSEQQGAGLRVGLIDAGVDDTHPVFAASVVHHHGCSDAAFPSSHGTAVASLLVGEAGNFRGAAAGGELYAADVYCGAATGGAVDAVAEAFAWLSGERIPVINVSLVGPANVILEQVVKLMIARGHVIVAAVGNDGPSAAAMYPASYPGVIGVTAVDERQRVLLEAARGKQVDFAAPGADMAAADAAHAFTAVRGTSFAAPIVAALLARSLPVPGKVAADQACSDLAAVAVDLGSRGPDRTYGNGLVGEKLKVAPRLAGVH